MKKLLTLAQGRNYFNQESMRSLARWQTKSALLIFTDQFMKSYMKTTSFSRKRKLFKKNRFYPKSKPKLKDLLQKLSKAKIVQLMLKDTRGLFISLSNLKGNESKRYFQQLMMIQMASSALRK